jgi:hypothetical protein
MIFDKENAYLSNSWTTGRLEEEFFLNLVSVKEKIYNDKGKAVTVHKYYHQAREKMYWIPPAKGNGRMSFVIHFSELTDKVRKELLRYYNDAGEKGFTILLKLALCRIFENLDPQYTHLSIMKNLRVKFIE